ncbi:MAG: carboxypeptidase regulatory-like domain-containing protein [Clostridiales bacterium]|jgi:hypothetical protein|nr:carboxypeptidase regulatory-like domain-containing protein [Clostridiales bacterium]
MGGVDEYWLYRKSAGESDYGEPMIRLPFENGAESVTCFSDDDVQGGRYAYKLEGVVILKDSGGNDVPIKSKAAEIEIEVPASLGTIRGSVKSAIDERPVEGAVISATPIDDQVGLKSVNIPSNSYGMFEFVLPADVRYDVKISKDGYMDVQYNNVSVPADEVINIETVLQIPSEYEGQRGNATGRIVNALTGGGVQGVAINVRRNMNASENEQVVKSAITDGYGNFALNELPTGNYTAEAKTDGFIPLYFNFVCIGGRNVSIGDKPITPTLSSDQIRIVLSWGADPRDLDSHLAMGSTHLYYGNRNAAGISLDTDNVTGYGPETITINTNEAAAGVYNYYVYLYSGSGSIGSSQTKVRVYSGDTLVKEYNAPSSFSERTWNVFSIDTRAKQITDSASPLSRSSRSLGGNNAEVQMILEDIATTKKRMMCSTTKSSNKKQMFLRILMMLRTLECMSNEFIAGA